MFTNKLLVAAALLTGIGAVHATAKEAAKPKVAPMTETDAKLTKCEVHGLELHTENVPIRYGRPFIQEGFWEAQQRDFPHANTYVLGGCVLTGDDPKLQTVKFCDDCRQAEKAWQDAHKLLQR